MKRIFLYLSLVLLAFSFYTARPVLAQSETPPAGPVGEIRGAVINRNTGKVVAESLEVMLHILDSNFAEKDMKHAQSQPDGTFVFADIPFDANLQFAAMATYEGVTYFSETLPADLESMQVVMDVPIYETTTDLATVQVDQMHVLFDLSTDGLETKELYIVSNTGERTVKDVYDLGNDKFAALKLPLPEDADYIFFKPDDQDRFIKLKGEFADTYPLLPGDRPTQIATDYLVPYSGKRTYTYTAPVDTSRINFIVPEQAGISLTAEGLQGPEVTTLQDGTIYQVYSYSDLKAGTSLSVTLSGTPLGAPKNTSASNALAISVALLGLAVIGIGVWWWRRPGTTEEEENGTVATMDEPRLDDLIAEIARLDETYEQEGLSPEEHQRRRQELMQRAKHLL
jgi:hypothetical protein